MRFNYNKLIGRIIEQYGTRGRFAAAMGMAESVLSSRLNQQINFSMEEISRAVELLGLTLEDIGLYFFTPMFHFMEQPTAKA